MNVIGADNPRYESAMQAALEKIFSSDVMGPKSRSRDLLTYIVAEELAGRGDRLKAYTIGIDVLGRSEDFDASTDSIVRVEANRLRQKLALYYKSVGRGDAYVLDIPKGSYRAVLCERKTGAKPAPLYPDEPRRGGGMRALLFAAFGFGAVFAAFLFLSPESHQRVPLLKDPPGSGSITVSVESMDPDQSDTGAATTSTSFLLQNLRAALSRNTGLRVVVPGPGNIATSDFAVRGSVQPLGPVDNVAVELVSHSDRSVVWARTYEAVHESETPALDGVVTKIARELGPQILLAMKKILASRDPLGMTPDELFVLSTWVPGEGVGTLETEKERIALARLALQKDPDFGPALSVLAGKLIYVAGVDPPSNTEAALQEASTSAKRAVKLAPADASTMFNVGVYHWHAGDMTAAVDAFMRVLELDPAHALADLAAHAAPFTCVAPPDDVLEDVSEFDAALEPDNPIRWVSLTWLSMLHMNRGEDELALEAEQRAARVFQTPDTAMRRAAILNRLGQTQQAAELILAQKKGWPSIGPAHFSTVTIPRRCHEAGESSRMPGYYNDLTASVASFMEAE